MTAPEAHLVKARASLAFAAFALKNRYADEAGRSAYMAAFHAAMAFIEHRTGKTPKTHRGVRSEFTRLAHTDPLFSQAHIALLGWAYELKNTADYEGGAPVAETDVVRAIAEASKLIVLVEQCLQVPGV